MTEFKMKRACLHKTRQQYTQDLFLTVAKKMKKKKKSHFTSNIQLFVSTDAGHSVPIAAPSTSVCSSQTEPEETMGPLGNKVGLVRLGQTVPTACGVSWNKGQGRARAAVTINRAACHGWLERLIVSKASYKALRECGAGTWSGRC